MRVLFVAYCLARHGESAIGVYKRTLRVARELWERGDEVHILCPGHQDYRDELTELAHRHARFIPLDFEFVIGSGGSARNRRRCLAVMAELQPELVVLGEAPLSGPMLEATLCALELGSRVALLDNAYGPELATDFWRRHGPLADGLVLTGPSSFHMPAPPARVAQVAPFVGRRRETAAVLAELGLAGERLVTVLAYDPKVERLGVSLAAALAGGDPAVEMVFVAPRPEATRRRLELAAPAAIDRIRVIPPSADEMLFALLAASRLAVVKYGFMQVSECLVLHTPAIVVYHHSFRWLQTLPVACGPFLHASEGDEADATTVAAARRLLATDPERMSAIHTGDCAGSAATAASFLASLAAGPPGQPCADLEGMGLLPAWFEAAAAARHPGEPVKLIDARAGILRRIWDYEMHAGVCRYERGGRQEALRLWIHVGPNPAAAARFASRLAGTWSRRPFLFHDRERGVVIEEAGDENLLLPLRALPERESPEERRRYRLASRVHVLLTFLRRRVWAGQPV